MKERMKKKMLDLFIPIIFILGLMASACQSDTVNSPRNERLPLDEGEDPYLSIDAAFPVLNKETAAVSTPSGDYYYASKVSGQMLTHEVVVENPDNESYSLQWLVDDVVVSGESANTFTVYPERFSSTPESLSGIHKVQVLLKNGGGTQVDQRTWLVDFRGGNMTFNHFTTSDISPDDSAVLTYSKATNPYVDFSVTFSDVDNTGYWYKWFLDDEELSDPGRSAPSPALYRGITSNVDNGTHTLELRFKDAMFLETYTSILWNIIITD